jgi:CubicO group peptidase (beta-lactamase class C family)
VIAGRCGTSLLLGHRGHRSRTRPSGAASREAVRASVAGAAGGEALVTTVQDLARFLDALLKGELFRHSDTLRQMLAFAPAPDVGGQVGYGLGIEQRASSRAASS